MPSIRIKIGASLDANLGEIVLRPLVEAARAARAAVRTELDGMSDDLRRASGRGARGGRAGAGAGAGSPYRTPSASDPGGDPAAPQRKRNRAVESEEDRHQREMEQKARKEAKQAEVLGRQLERETERRRERISSAAVSNFGGLVRRGAGIAGDLARGAGIDFSLGGAAQSRFDLQKRATDLSNAGFMQGDKLNGTRQDPRALMGSVQEAANGAALDTGQAMEGLQQFVGKTGDLATGRAVLADMAKLSRATGADLSDVVSAAGDVAANLGDNFSSAEAKAKAVSTVMRAIAGQGKVGAVEMKDLASQMAKLAASAPMFAGNVEANMGAMGALAQEARAHGGAASATQAATSVQGFVSTFSKKARRKEFKNAGIDIEDKAGKLLDPEDIIVNALKKTGGNKEKMNALFMDAGAQRVTRGFQTIFNEAKSSKEAQEASKKAGGGAKGDAAATKVAEEAVRSEFGKLRLASMGKGEVEDSFNASMQTAEAQAQLAKNKIQQSLGDAVDKLAPKMLQLVPGITEATTAFGQFVGWAASNPWKAAFAGFGASIMKAVGEEMMRNATSKMFSGGIGGGGLGGGAGGAGAGGKFLGGLAGDGKMATAMNIAGAAVAITATAITIGEVGALMIDKAIDAKDKRGAKSIGDDMGALNAQTRLTHAQAEADRYVRAEGFVTSSKGMAAMEELANAQNAAQQEKEKLSGRIDLGKAFQNDTEGARFGLADAAFNSLTGTNWAGAGENLDSRGQAELSAQKLDQLNAQMQALGDILGGQLQVTVKNMPEGGGPFVSGASRTGPGDGG